MSSLPSPGRPSESAAETVISSERRIIGRESERAALRAFLARRDGPAALVLDGDAGVGKSTLWEEALRDASASGQRVLRCRPTSSETQLAFAAIADVLRGRAVREAMAALPAPQRHALAVALLDEEASGAPPDVRAIAAGLLGVVRQIAGQAPVVLAIDDVQWLDVSSRSVLEFTARRVPDVQVVMLVARRTTGDESLPLGLSAWQPGYRVAHIRLGPMGLGALDELLRSRLELALSRPWLTRVGASAGGNPFYALELGRALQRRGLPDAPGGGLPLPGNLQSVVSDRLANLPDDVMALLQRVEMLYDRRVVTVRRVAAAEGLEDALDRAVQAGVLEVAGERLTFSHALLGSAVQSLTGPIRRAALHRRLAELESSGEARALHLALSASGPDAALADEIARAAADAAARGASDSAGRLAEYAAALTPEADTKVNASRTVLAAEHHVAAGDPGRARSLLSVLVERLPAGPDRAAALSLLCWVHPAAGSFADSVRLGEQAIAEAHGNDRLIAQTRQQLSVAERIGMRLAASEEHARAAVQSATRAGDRALLALSLASLGQTRLALGAGVGDELHRAAELERELPEFLGQQSPARRLGFALTATDQPAEAQRVLSILHARAAAAGHEDARALVLSELGDLSRRTGDWSRAAELYREATELSRQASTGQEQNAIAVGAALLEAGLGHDDEARTLALHGLERSERLGDRIHVLQARGVLGFLELSLGRYAAAAQWLGAASDELIGQGVVELGIYPEVVPNEIEARLALGERDRAEWLTGELEARARRTARPWMCATAARSRGLLHAAAGELDLAREQLHAALAAHHRTGQPFELARTLTVLGALERRSKQRRASRAALEQARALLDDLPAPLWTARVAAELARLGEQPAPTELSATEGRIAALAAAGRTNPEIAAEVFVSRKTVEANLSSIYRKLGVRSRVELARRFDR